MKRAALLMLSLVLTVASLAAGGPSSRTVILVRHAEKATTDPDTALSPAGQVRASELARVLSAAHVKTIYVTELKRTQQTAAPLATKLKLTPVIIPTGEAQAAALVKAIRGTAAGDTILLVGHSNTIPGILALLGIPGPPVLTDADYGELFICTVPDHGPPSLVHLKYGG